MPITGSFGKVFFCVTKDNVTLSNLGDMEVCQIFGSDKPDLQFHKFGDIKLATLEKKIFVINPKHLMIHQND